MRNEDRPTTGPAAESPESARLPARVFYGVIAAGVLVGVIAAGGAAWASVAAGAKPEGRRIWADVADSFVVPVAAMVGGTFGGLGGFATAVLLDRARRP